MMNPQMPAREEQAPIQMTPMRVTIMLLCAILCAVPLIQALAPRAIGFIPAASGLIFFLAARLFNGGWPRLNRIYVMLALGIGALAALSTLWSLDPDFALERSLKITGLLFGGCLLFAVMRLGISWPRFLYACFPLMLFYRLRFCCCPPLDFYICLHALRDKNVRFCWRFWL